MRQAARPTPRTWRAAMLGTSLLSIAAAAGCTDAFDRPGTWNPSGVNDSNLRVMVVDPAQLRRGVGSATARGQAGSVPITNLEAGERPLLPSTQLSTVGGGGAGGATGAR